MRGLDVNGTHNFELKDVPTTLNWEGGLFPTAKSPRVKTRANDRDFPGQR